MAHPIYTGNPNLATTNPYSGAKGNSHTTAVPASPYASDDMYLAFALASDPNRKAGLLQDINRSLSAQAAPEGFAGNMMEYLLTLMRSRGISKSKTPITNNMVGIQDALALENVIKAAQASSLRPVEWLSRQLPDTGGAVKKKRDVSTQFTRQIQTAFQYLDLGDAREAYTDAYFVAHGYYPSKDLDTKFQTAWNNKEKNQNQPTTTKTTTEFAPVYDTKSNPVIDKKTKKQAVDKFGNKKYSKFAYDVNGERRYETVIKGTSTRQGLGFTDEEQDRLLAEFIVNNSPEEKWNAEDIRGAAKSIFNSLQSAHTNNYDTAPDLATLTPMIKSLLKSTDEKVSETIMKDYVDSIRAKTGSRFMSLSEVLAGGKDAIENVAPLLTNVSTYLEKDFTVDDPFIKQILNFQGSDGKYRMMNDYELDQAVKAHPAYAKTSKAKNESVNLYQTLKGQLA